MPFSRPATMNKKADKNYCIMTLETCFNPFPHNPDF